MYMNKQTLANTGFTVTFTRTYAEMFEFALAARNILTGITMSIRQIRIKTESLWFHIGLISLISFFCFRVLDSVN